MVVVGLLVSVAVSVLKPLCGAEPRLYENLATFCEQHHPRFQLLFGVSSPTDPAIAVVRQLQAAMGQRVQLTYAQHVGVPTSCFGETEYFVEKAVIGGSNPVAPGNM